jgi:hypothetical protein
MPSHNYSIASVIESRSTPVVYSPAIGDVSAPIDDFVVAANYELTPLALPAVTLPMVYVIDTRMTTVTIASWSPFLEKNLLAVFTLQRDEDGDMIFADTTGAMYGIGASFLEAVQDWHDSAQELQAQLNEHGGVLLRQVMEQLELFDSVLPETPALGRA